MRLVRTMNSLGGRAARVLAGLALISLGVAAGGPGGVALAVIGLVPLLAGATRVCLAAAFMGASPRAH